jgi:formamidopyrimidine-DNA glycosylase
MPELPEVETIRQNLRIGFQDQPPLLGRLIQSAEVRWARSIAFPTPDEFRARISGQTILEIGRRGKYLIFHLSDNKLLIHLRMSGDLIVRNTEHPELQHDRIILYLENQLRLAFNDTRKFGRFWLVNDVGQVINDLGPEPFDPELTDRAFYERLQVTHRQLKPLLMDQSFLAGMGNIYTDEALNLARLHPLTLSNQVTSAQSSSLLDSIRKVLEAGIQTHGASIDWVYRGGDFQNYFRVYQRTGSPCPECGEQVEKITVGQRGTHYCPNCQKLPT